jgi:hypothetical protein
MDQPLEELSLRASGIARREQGEPRVMEFNVSLAYLRTFIIVLVVAHHATMAYNVVLTEPVASSLSEHLQSMRAISSVIDEDRSPALSLFAAFNDNFFMPLLFLVSGLFVLNSMQRRGRLSFVRERLIRLGLPLGLMVVLRPLTYYPTYLQIGGEGGFADFWQQWSAIGWRGGPIWFVEVLLFFNVILALVPGLDYLSGRVSRMKSAQPLQPFKSFALLALLSAAASVSMVAVFGPFFWQQVGPAQVQMDRLLLYAVYFFAGVSLGAYGLDRTFLVADSRLARRWIVWSLAGLVGFVVNVGAAIGDANALVTGFLFAISCAAISFALLAIFLRFVRMRRRSFDSLFENSYGIYVIHYGVVAWLSYALLDAPLSVATKWLIVFISSLALCWVAVAALRRIPRVARVL